MFYIVEWKQEPVSEYKGLSDAENEQNKYPFSIVKLSNSIPYSCNEIRILQIEFDNWIFLLNGMHVDAFWSYVNSIAWLENHFD